MDLNSAGINQIISNSLTQASDVNVLAKKAELAGGNKDAAAAAKEFEAVFITQMIQHMFSGVETNELFGGGHAEDTYKTLLFDEYGKAISRAGGIGIAEQVQRELIKLQEMEQ